MDKVPTLIYTKAVTGGNDNLAILGYRQRLVAHLNIPNWKRIRIGMFHSQTPVANPNALAANATESVSGSMAAGAYMGLFTHPNLHADNASVSGYTLGSPVTSGEIFAANTSFGRLGYSSGGFPRGGVINNGVLTTHAALTSLNWYVARAGASETLNFATACRWEIERNAGATTIGLVHQDSSAHTNVSMNALRTLMSASITYLKGLDAVAGGYHELPTPYFVMQWPFVNRRLRIHAWRVEVMETL